MRKVSEIDWEALYTASVTAGIVMIAVLFATMFVVLLFVVSYATFGGLYFIVLGLAFAGLTSLFYKYEKSVNEEGY